MPVRIDLGTDIALIGVWDPTHERHDLGRAKYETLQSELRREAEQGYLFFVETHADGSYLCDIYVDELLESDHLTLYTPVERDFLVVSNSGQLIAGGLEDFIGPKKRITSKESYFSIQPGSYALQFYSLCDEEEFDKHIQQVIGADDYALYSKSMNRIPWGCLTFVLALASVMLKQWIVTLALLVVWAIVVYVRKPLLNANTQLQEIIRRVRQIENQFPPYLLIFKRLAHNEGMRGGWHSLE